MTAPVPTAPFPATPSLVHVPTALWSTPVGGGCLYVAAVSRRQGALGLGRAAPNPEMLHVSFLGDDTHLRAAGAWPIDLVPAGEYGFQPKVVLSGMSLGVDLAERMLHVLARHQSPLMAQTPEVSVFGAAVVAVEERLTVGTFRRGALRDFLDDRYEEAAVRGSPFARSAPDEQIADMLMDQADALVARYIALAVLVAAGVVPTAAESQRVRDAWAAALQVVAAIDAELERRAQGGVVCTDWDGPVATWEDFLVRAQTTKLERAGAVWAARATALPPVLQAALDRADLVEAVGVVGALRARTQRAAHNETGAARAPETDPSGARRKM